MVQRGGVSMGEEVRGREWSKLKSFELGPTIRTVVMVNSDF